MTSKWHKYNRFILDNVDKSKSNIARAIIHKYDLDPAHFQALRNYIQRYLLRYDNSALEEYCDAHGIPVDDVTGYWHKGKYKDVGLSVRVDANKEEPFTIEDVKEVVEDIVTGYKPVTLDSVYRFENVNKRKNNKQALKLVLSDIHTGMDTNPDHKSLFPYIYNEEIFNKNLNEVYESIIEEYKNNGKFELFIFNDLGDGLDGWDGYTTRGGHKLDQAYNNRQSFRIYVEGKYKLIRRVIEAGVADNYSIRAVSNCNHSGDFGYIANKTLEYMLQCAGVDVEFHHIERFMEHFVYGEHCFILTHGKDSNYMTKGLPLVLNDRTINFVTDYIIDNKIHSKYIHLEKGDLHQIGYQSCNRFDYRNYMSFAPPSAWIQHNFGSCYSGYSLQIISKHTNKIKHLDIFLEQVKK